MTTPKPEGAPRCPHCKGTRENPMPLSNAGSRCFEPFHDPAQPAATAGKASREQSAMNRAHAIVRMWLELDDGTEQEQRDRLVEDIADAIIEARAPAEPSDSAAQLEQAYDQGQADAAEGGKR
jgi:hypothetical protein